MFIIMFIMIYAETDRFPLSIDINIRIIKYWIKLIHNNPDSLIFTVYKESLKHQMFGYDA